MTPNRLIIHRAITFALLDVPHLEPTCKDVTDMTDRVYQYLEGAGYEAVIKQNLKEEKE
jgi:hypothetical protein